MSKKSKVSYWKEVKFNIDIYDWDIQYIELKDYSHLKKLKKIMTEFHCDSKELNKVMIDLKAKATNVGVHFYDLNKRKTFILLYPCRTNEDKMDIICHEKRHAEDRILIHLGIDDIESAGFLAGFIAKKILS